MPRITDETHGTVVVTTTETRVLAAVATTAAEITRSGDETRPDVPIGTRDADCLTLVVNGSPARLAPGNGRYSRRSYRVDAWVGDVHYLLKPEADGSTLLADGVERGFFPEQNLPAVWLPGSSPQDAAIGYALAAAFGVQARSLYDTVFHAAVDPVVGTQRPIT
ncbi:MULTISPECIES: hypothetical protein [Actinokineospora]|uniref:Uncharacterized protein n=1 Tax=Actinokineospora fastidiosa TaxID=1816 RepID=A0A918G1U0_9PSEU|nr:MULTISPECIES: hypothetical protein [Actinokineospora]UVS76935.1 hypothetical protein Actkin_00632 [Actinokineospora sp. UTMC 2448]GGS14751.1 hypothetical protein GCM10010171_03330 [Actinokineospora fastidiosa]